MPKPLKVFGTMLDGRRRFIVAARSLTEAARLWGVRRHRIADYASETGNEVELAVALAEPGTVFVSKSPFLKYEKYVNSRAQQ